MDIIKRITVICFAVIVLAANLPLCASATDPVSAATMANALAQAISAYGASQGVSMTFDVASTDGIGEGVHELWDQFVEDVNDPNTPTYDSLAVTMWSNLYSKIGNNLGINISASEMPFIDSFWNWLLSGPAEMTKVDNEYYQWSLNQNNTVDPIIVSSSLPYPTVPYGVSNLVLSNTQYVGTISGRLLGLYYRNNSATPYPTYIFGYYNNNSKFIGAVCTGNNYIGTIYSARFYDNGNFVSGSETSIYQNTINGVDYVYSNIPVENFAGNIASYSSLNEGINAVSSYISDPYTDDISLRPYIGDTAPQNVYIPDNTDVNYNPTDVAIPLDIPWDNTLFGDGDGVLTDAQSEAAAAAADDAITDSLEKTLTLADTENPDIPAPNEVYIPLLPVELPSFNFSLSGIWHYVVSWVQSLGAWLSLMFQTWAVLPSAITIPVYATAVIVIVLGVYKRFFM